MSTDLGPKTTQRGLTRPEIEVAIRADRELRQRELLERRLKGRPPLSPDWIDDATPPHMDGRDHG